MISSREYVWFYRFGHPSKELAFGVKRCSIKAFKLLPCAVAMIGNFCRGSIGKSMVFLFLLNVNVVMLFPDFL